MPVFEGVHGVPKKKPPQKTKVQPFNLRIEERGAARQQEIQHEVKISPIDLILKFIPLFYHRWK